MNYKQITEKIIDFEEFLERNASFSGGFGRWARETEWPIKLTCYHCCLFFELEKSAINGKSGVWLGSAEVYTAFIVVLLECPHCKKSGLFQICKGMKP